MPSRLPRAVRPGWTVLETVIVLMIAGLMAGLVTLGTQWGQEQTLDEQARRMLQRMRAARADAVMTATQARLYIRENEGEEGLGRYLAVQLALGQDSADAAAGDWVSLRDHVSFGTGAASTGPLGAPASDPVPLAEVHCTSDGTCDLGGPAALTYYLTDTLQAGEVRAITLSQSGESRLYTYRPESGQWH